MNSEKALFIPRACPMNLREQRAIEDLLDYNGGRVSVWFDGRAAVMDVISGSIPYELRVKGELFGATDEKRLDRLEQQRPELSMAIGVFRLMTA